MSNKPHKIAHIYIYLSIYAEINNLTVCMLPVKDIYSIYLLNLLPILWGYIPIYRESMVSKPMDNKIS